MKITIELEQIKPNEKIPPGAFHTLNDGEPHPILNKNTIGLTPGDFATDRKFYRIKNSLRKWK